MIMTIKHSKAFSLIELMVTFAIVLIISLISYPTLINYFTQSKVADALQALTPIQSMVTNNIASNGSTTNSGLNLNTPATVSRNVASYSVGDDGVISVTTTSDAGGVSFTLSPVYNSTAEQVSWTCAVSNSSMNSSVPAQCRI